MTRLEKFRITSQQAGVLGVYEAESPETALDALARDAGYTSHAASMSDAIGEADDWTTSPAAFAGGSIGLLVEPATPRAAITIERDGAFYLMALDYTALPISPPLPTRTAAVRLRDAIIALSDADYADVICGRKPAPGCSWLISSEVDQ